MLRFAQHECFVALFLDAESRLLGEAMLGWGNSGSLHFRMRDLFSRALEVKANSLVIAHNHPSGDCRPSPCDIAATDRIKQVASALDIDLLDHLIITKTSVYSMRAGGNL